MSGIKRYTRGKYKIFILSTCADCNLRCTYCHGDEDSDPEDYMMMPNKPSYSMETLEKHFSSVPDDELVVVFYGGEPLLNLAFIKQVMDARPEARYVLQSNCTLLHNLPTEYLLRFHAILASIDGRPEVFNQYRGPKVYDLVMKRLKDVRERGFKGDIVARMANSLKNEIYEEVSHLLSAGDGLFDAVYWQNDVEWDFDDTDKPWNVRWGDSKWGGYEEYLEQSYFPGIAKLFEEWIEELKNGKCHKIVPFIGVAQAVLFGETATKNGGLFCSCGHKGYAICTDGRIQICPVGFEDEWNRVGHIEGDVPADIYGMNVSVDSKCKNCDIYDYCGGRCLWANKTKYWGENGFDIVCSTVRQLVDLVNEHSEEIILASKNPIVAPHLLWDAGSISLEVIP